MDKPKLIVIGLDGASLKLIRDWESEMPFISDMMANGVRGNLASTIPPLTSPAWGTLITGKNPGKHRIFNMSRENPFNKDEIAPTTGSDLQAERIWTILNRHNLKVGVADFPLILQPEPVKSFMVCNLSNWGQEKGQTYPYSLKKELLAETNMKFEGSIMDGMSPNLSYLEKITESVNSKGNLDNYLLNKFEVDVFLTVYEHTDTLQHIFWRQLQKSVSTDTKEAIQWKSHFSKFFQNLDKSIKKTVKNSGKDATVIIVSDHGFGTVDRVVAINEFLLRKDFLSIKNNPSNSIRKYIRKLGLNLNNLRKIYFKLRMESILGKRIDFLRKTTKFAESLVTSPVDLDFSKAYSPSGTMGGIYLNNNVSEVEYYKLRESVMKALNDLVDTKTGKSPFIGVYPREKIYKGQYTNKSPDIVALKKDNYQIKTQIESGRIFYNRWEGGDHALNGIFIANGPIIQNNIEISGAKLQDVVPTILYMLHLPIPKDIDGHILKDIFKENYLDSTSSMYEDPTPFSIDKIYKKPTKKQEEEVKKRLEALGYLE